MSSPFQKPPGEWGKQNWKLISSSWGGRPWALLSHLGTTLRKELWEADENMKGSVGLASSRMH
jgi:hypothetical protein